MNSFLLHGGSYDYDYGYYYGPYGYVSVGPFAYVVFASCWTLSFNFYLFLTSDTATYTRSERAVGRFFNPSIALTVDCLSAIFWFAGFILLAQISQFYLGEETGMYSLEIISTLIGVGIWYDIAHPRP